MSRAAGVMIVLALMYIFSPFSKARFTSSSLTKSTTWRPLLEVLAAADAGAAGGG